MDERKRKQQFLAESGEYGFEEFSSEVAGVVPASKGRVLNPPEDDRPELSRREFRANGQEESQARTEPGTLGWTALITAFISLFLWPYVLGPAAAVLGLAAFFQGKRALGLWSAVIGIISMLSYWFLVPYYA